MLFKVPFASFLFVLFSFNLFGQVNVYNPEISTTSWIDKWVEIGGERDEYLFARPKYDFEIASINYSLLDSIRLNDKFELGIAFPEELQNEILRFVRSNGESEGLNPFDPQKIDVQAVFSHVDENGVTIDEKAFGFFYQEYRRDSNLKGWSTMNGADPYIFRIRFAPKFTGVWKCNISALLPQQQTVLRSESFYFMVTDTGLPSYVKISDNKRYFELDDELFIPVGSNLPAQGTLATGYTKNGADPQAYIGYHAAVDALKDAGANYFRYMFTPWTTEIEFEKLGNYSGRMPQAWEMDQLVEHIEEIDLRMHFNMSYTTPLSYTGLFSMYRWDWTNGSDPYIHCDAIGGWFEDDRGYCYHADSTYGVQNIDDFFVDKDSRRFYKNRLRYIVSRWGYSTHIFALELMNEINFSGVRYGMKEDCGVDPSIFEYKPYFHDTSYVRKLSEWQIEMGRYIKEELQEKDHPFCVNYGGTPNYVNASNYHFDEEDGISLYAGDSTYFSEFIDIMSYNDYFSRIEKYEFQSKDYKMLKETDADFYKKRNANAKPLMYSEMGVGLHGCDNQFTYRQMMVMSAFSGAAGPGLAWRFNNNDPEFENEQNRMNAWRILPVVKAFFEDVPLHEGNWQPGFDLRKDKKAEMLFLTEKASSSQRAVAVINNRTVNRYSMREEWCDESPESCDCSLTEEQEARTDEVYKNGAAFDWKTDSGIGGSQLLKIDGMEYTSKYRIVFYDGFSGAYVSETTKWSDAIGQLKIKYPKLADTPDGGDSDANGSMLLVKIRKEGTESFSEVE